MIYRPNNVIFKMRFLEFILRISKISFSLISKVMRSSNSLPIMSKNESLKFQRTRQSPSWSNKKAPSFPLCNPCSKSLIKKFFAKNPSRLTKKKRITRKHAKSRLENYFRKKNLIYCSAENQPWTLTEGRLIYFLSIIK